MVRREHWIKRIEEGWKRRSIIWLAGVRRVGKTFLCQSLDNVEIFDCELPRVRRLLADPEAFLKEFQGRRLILDEIHRLENPSEILKIAADHFPTTKVIATGSSTLEASKKFRDTLTGRKVLIHLTPMLFHETAEFDGMTLQHRLLHGGLPPFFLEDQVPEESFQEWLSSYWAKDIQELFRVEKRHSFIKFTELILAQSGSLFEATRFAPLCEVSRTTIANYLSVLEATYVAYIVRPFSTHRATEIVKAPLIYGFDTGFVCHARGWNALRPEDLGTLWEHLVLNELKGRFPTMQVHYWRDKRDHEIDFVLLKGRNKAPITVECKWSADRFTPTNLRSFRQHYPHGENFVVAPDVDHKMTRDYEGIEVTFASLEQLVQALEDV